MILEIFIYINVFKRIYVINTMYTYCCKKKQSTPMDRDHAKERPDPWSLSAMAVSRRRAISGVM